MNNIGDFKIDSRTKEDILAEIARLAQSYTPEWAFDTQNPDIGSVIAMLFANQMAGNIRRLNEIEDKYHTEFINLLDLSLNAAFPAMGVAVFDIIPDTVSGLPVPKGVKLLADNESDNVVFETQNDVFVTNSNLTDIVAISGVHGSINPIRGDWKAQPLVKLGTNDEPNLYNNDEIHLFDYSGDNIAKSAIVMYHKSLFDTAEGVSIKIYADSSEDGQLSSWLCDDKNCKWYYLSKNGLEQINAYLSDDGGVVLTKGGENEHIKFNGEEYAVICAESCGIPRNSKQFDYLEISASCEPTIPDGIIHNEEQLDVQSCMPFGDTASIFDECYITHDRIFRQQGAHIEMTFTLSYEEKMVDLMPEQVEKELKVIKRRPKTNQIIIPEAFVQRMTIEYFNGKGWYRLKTETDWQTLFDGTHDGDTTIKFLCPDDWQTSIIGGMEGRMIRLRVMQSDNCFLQPCVHHMPRLDNMKLSYRYDGSKRIPQRVERICGALREDITECVQNGKSFTAFSSLAYTENSLLLGFDKPFSGAPISIFFDIQENLQLENVPISFLYSSSNGFKPLSVIDGTNSMRQSGTVKFYTPDDFMSYNVEGHKRYWIKIIDSAGVFDKKSTAHPTIHNILVNAVEIRNIETLPDKQFFIESAMPNMVFPLETDHILYADVFVNELGALTKAEMQQLINDKPQDVHVTYNAIGEISSFFVRWTEIDSFELSNKGDRHYQIDRMLNELHFGDGVRVRIPRAQNDVAIIVRVKRCEGAKGNLDTGAINRTYGNMMYIDNVYNPTPTTSGSNVESIESAQLRGTNLISAQNRLVSLLDYKRAVMAYSSVISKVKCISGYMPDGNRNSRAISIAIMMKDYLSGSYSFDNIKKPLSDFLIDKCETTIDRNDLYISEPIYIEISVNVWVETTKQEQVFKLQNTLIDKINAFIDPLGNMNNWEIGEMPDERQIGMLLRTTDIDANIRRFFVSAKKVCKDGVHICSLDELKRTPFMIGVNGEHRVHVTYIG